MNSTFYGTDRISGVAKRVVFQKGGFGGCSPGTKTGTRAHSDVPPEGKPEQGYVRMFPRNENQNEGTLDGGNRALVIGPLVETNFEASKTQSLKAFQSLKNRVD